MQCIGMSLQDLTNVVEDVVEDATVITELVYSYEYNTKYSTFTTYQCKPLLKQSDLCTHFASAILLNSHSYFSPNAKNYTFDVRHRAFCLQILV